MMHAVITTFIHFRETSIMQMTGLKKHQDEISKSWYIINSVIHTFRTYCYEHTPIIHKHLESVY